MCGTARELAPAPDLGALTLDPSAAEAAQQAVVSLDPGVDADVSVDPVDAIISAEPDVAAEAEANGLDDATICQSCGEALEPDDSFCTNCGASRDGSTVAHHPHDNEVSVGDEQRGRGVVIALGVLTILAIGGGGYWYVHRPTSVETAVATAVEADTALPTAKSETDTTADGPLADPSPLFSGAFRGTAGDQTITMTLNANGSKPLSSTSGVVKYTNRVVNRECAAQLVPRPKPAEGEGQQFDQLPVAGMIACERNIRVRLSPGENAPSLVIAVWTDPLTGAELMRSTLQQEN